MLENKIDENRTQTELYDDLKIRLEETQNTQEDLQNKIKKLSAENSQISEDKKELFEKIEVLERKLKETERKKEDPITIPSQVSLTMHSHSAAQPPPRVRLTSGVNTLQEEKELSGKLEKEREDILKLISKSNIEIKIGNQDKIELDKKYQELLRNSKK